MNRDSLISRKELLVGGAALAAGAAVNSDANPPKTVPDKLVVLTLDDAVPEPLLAELSEAIEAEQVRLVEL